MSASSAYRRERVHPRAARRARRGWCAMAATSRLPRPFEACKTCPSSPRRRGSNGLIAEALDAAALPPADMAELVATVAKAPARPRSCSRRCASSSRIWPVLSIWSAHQAGGDLETAWRHQTASRSASRLWRNRRQRPLSPPQRRPVRLSACAESGLGLEHAVARALAHDPMFDLVAALGSLFGDGLVTARSHQPANIN